MTNGDKTRQMSDKTLEIIVPPLNLCKQIPEGQFSDSALVWRKMYGMYDVFPRACGFCARFENYEYLAPAPTKDEIVADLKRRGFVSSIQTWSESMNQWVFEVAGADAMSIADQIATAAMKSWMRIAVGKTEKRETSENPPANMTKEARRKH